jgi:hypothetical protein
MWRYRLWLWRPGLEKYLKYICAGETTPGVIMRAIIFALIEVVFHGPHSMELHT